MKKVKSVSGSNCATIFASPDARVQEKLNAETKRIVADVIKSWQALSKNERAKFPELIRHIKIHGDVSKAAERAGISKELLRKLLSVFAPAMIWEVRYTASGNLMRAKLRKGGASRGEAGRTRLEGISLAYSLSR
jgi:hypothetical protein